MNKLFAMKPNPNRVKTVEISDGQGYYDQSDAGEDEGEEATDAQGNVVIVKDINAIVD